MSYFIAGSTFSERYISLLTISDSSFNNQSRDSQAYLFQMNSLNAFNIIIERNSITNYVLFLVINYFVSETIQQLNSIKLVKIEGNTLISSVSVLAYISATNYNNLELSDISIDNNTFDTELESISFVVAEYVQSLIVKNVEFNDMINSRFIQVNTLFKVIFKNIKLTQADCNSLV